jgi:HlyD family secretion protein
LVPRSLAAAALAALALAAACSKPPVEQYRTDTISKGPITEVVSATGGVEAITTVNIGSQVSGTISNLLVDFNSLVKKNQLLAEIDPRLFRASAERADAGLASARAQVERAQAVLADAVRQEARATELFNNKLTSRADVDTATANREQAAASLSIAKAGVLQAKADRDTAFANLAYTKITSPIDGIVVSRAIDKGQTVAASFQTPTLFTIANDLTKMQILANIDEADVGKVREQMETRFTVDAWPGETFTGRIREVRQAPTTIQNVVTYAAVIDAPNPERKLRQGMTASVQITTGKREEVLRVPNAALRFKPSAGTGDPAGDAKGDGKGKGERAMAAGSGSGSRERGSGERGGMRGERGGWGSGREGREGGAPREGGEPGGRKVSRMGKIYKLVDGKAVGVPVRLGLGDSQRTEVLEGLAENDVVIVGELGSMQGGQNRSPMSPGGPPGGGGMRRGF